MLRSLPFLSNQRSPPSYINLTTNNPKGDGPMSNSPIETKESSWHDKSRWLRGPWDDEPDKRQWSDPSTGLPCLIVRGPSGALCGYVGVSAGHPQYEMEDADVEVHGGITYSAFCQADGGHICHETCDEHDKVWWLGFDCSHSGDMRPMYANNGLSIYDDYGNSYKDFSYVEREVSDLARQLAAMTTEPIAS